MTRVLNEIESEQKIVEAAVKWRKAQYAVTRMDEERLLVLKLMDGSEAHKQLYIKAVEAVHAPCKVERELGWKLTDLLDEYIGDNP